MDQKRSQPLNQRSHHLLNLRNQKSHPKRQRKPQLREKPQLKEPKVKQHETDLSAKLRNKVRIE